MDQSDFMTWRASRYTQEQAARALGVTRATIQNWEKGRTRIPRTAELACFQVKRRPDFGPVFLVFADTPDWQELERSSCVVLLRCQQCPSNEVAIQLAAHRLVPLTQEYQIIMQESGDIIWSGPELLSECERRRTNTKSLDEELPQRSSRKKSDLGEETRESKVASSLPARATAGREARYAMDLWNFKKWRRMLKLSQFDAARELGVGRAAIRHWESGRVSISKAVELACEELTRRWRQRTEFGPVVLMYTDEPAWQDDCDARTLSAQCELCPNNGAALHRACSLQRGSAHLSALIVGEDGEAIWAGQELLQECEQRTGGCQF